MGGELNIVKTSVENKINLIARPGDVDSYRHVVGVSVEHAIALVVLSQAEYYLYQDYYELGERWDLAFRHTSRQVVLGLVLESDVVFRWAFGVWGKWESPHGPSGVDTLLKYNKLQQPYGGDPRGAYLKGNILFNWTKIGNMHVLGKFDAGVMPKRSPQKYLKTYMEDIHDSAKQCFTVFKEINDVLEQWLKFAEELNTAFSEQKSSVVEKVVANELRQVAEDQCQGGHLVSGRASRSPNESSKDLAIVASGQTARIQYKQIPTDAVKVAQEIADKVRKGHSSVNNTKSGKDNPVVIEKPREPDQNGARPLSVLYTDKVRYLRIPMEIGHSKTIAYTRPSKQQLEQEIALTNFKAELAEATEEKWLRGAHRQAAPEAQRITGTSNGSKSHTMETELYYQDAVKFRPTILGAHIPLKRNRFGLRTPKAANALNSIRYPQSEGRLNRSQLRHVEFSRADRRT
ncbi:hypothetical protein CHU98_g7415 [Xylaria longipes]|nr:hypothetical protein CHU98_g7415 [Xylaria longipes]